MESLLSSHSQTYQKLIDDSSDADDDNWCISSDTRDNNKVKPTPALPHTPDSSEETSGYESADLRTTPALREISQEEVCECLKRNTVISKGAITHSIKIAATGDYLKAAQTLETALALIRCSAIALDDRCQTLMRSLQDMHDVYDKLSKESLTPGISEKSSGVSQKVNSQLGESSKETDRLPNKGNRLCRGQQQSTMMDSSNIAPFSQKRHQNQAVFEPQCCKIQKVASTTRQSSFSFTDPVSSDQTRDWLADPKIDLHPLQSDDSFPQVGIAAHNLKTSVLPTLVSCSGSSNSNPFLKGQAHSSGQTDYRAQHSGCHVESNIASHGQSITAPNASCCFIQNNGAFGCGNTFYPK